MGLSVYEHQPCTTSDSFTTHKKLRLPWTLKARDKFAVEEDVDRLYETSGSGEACVWRDVINITQEMTIIEIMEKLYKVFSSMNSFEIDPHNLEVYMDPIA